MPAAWAWAEASGKARSMAATSWLCKVWAMRSMGPKTAVAAANPPIIPRRPKGIRKEQAQRTGSKRMLKSSQGLRVIGALVEIRSMPVAP